MGHEDLKSLTCRQIKEREKGSQCASFLDSLSPYQPEELAQT